MSIIKKLLSIGAIISMTVSSLSGIPAVKAEEPINSLSDLKVCSISEPLGIDETPVFSWIINMPNSFGAEQTSYRIKVSSTRQKTQNGNADIWDSGTVESDNSTSVTYGGKELSVKTMYYWTVTCRAGETELKSDVSRFSTGMLSDGDFKGEWIGKTSQSLSADLKGTEWIWLSDKSDSAIPAQTLFFRKKFTTDKSKRIKSVHAAFTSDDNAEFYFNGSLRARCDLWSIGILTDLTDYAVNGENIIAIKAQNATEGYAGLIAKVIITYSDDTVQTILTDNSWLISESEQSGWKDSDHSDNAWKAPNKIKSYGSAPWGSSVNLQADGERSEIMLRKEFTTAAAKTVLRATAYVCGLGFFDFKLNGQSPDDSVLNPFSAQYDKTVLYRTFDVTDLINSGDNAIGVGLGNGFYNETVGIWNWDSAPWRDSPKLKFELLIEYSDGEQQSVVSDESWKMTADGPIKDNSIYYGETYDAAREQTGFDLFGFDDSAWTSAKLVKAPTGKLKSQMKAPIKRTAEFSPKSVTRLENGSYIVKSPEMVSGWLKLLRINEKRGTKITITYGQKLNKDGTVVKWGGADGRDSSGFPYANLQQDNYICKGEKDESFEPKFSYKGYVYAQIDGISELKPEDITIYRVSNGVDIISDFSTSDNMINTLHSMMRNSVANNFQGEHCDPLIEKNGWLGDANVSLGSMMYNFDMTGALPGFIDLMEDGFELYGTVPIMVPTSNWGIHNYPVWNSLFVFGVEELENYFGTGAYTVRQYDVMRKYTLKDIAQIKNSGWVWGDDELADWVSPMGGSDPDAAYNENPSEGSGIVATGYVYKLLCSMSKIADALGKSSDAAEYREAADKIYAAFNAKFYNAQKQIYETTVWNQIGQRTKYRQTSNLVPIAFGLVPNDKKDAVIGNLVKDIKDKNYHLDTGCVGTALILPVLCDNGYSHIAYKILKQTTYPSWGFWLEQNTDSLWEMWETSSRSFDHYFLGTYEEWFFSGLAGITDIESGYKKFTVKPNVKNDIDNVNCKLNTARGTVESSWKILSDGGFSLTVQVPVGSTAKIVLPTKINTNITVNSLPPDQAAGIESVQTDDSKSDGSRIVLTAKSGKYEIVSACTDRLRSELAQARELDKSNYSPTAWADFEKELESIQKSLDSTSAAQSDIQSALTKLQYALKQLGDNLFTEKIELEEYIQKVSVGLKKSDFVQSAFENYQAALSNAQNSVNSDDITAAACSSALKLLKASVNELMKFRVGNIALGKTAVASSSVNDNLWGISKLTDGDRKNKTSYGYLGWSSSSDTAKNHTEWAYIDLELEATFDTVVVYPSSTEINSKNSCYGFPEDFNIYVSNDAKTWEKVYSESGYKTPSYEPLTFKFESVRARYIKFEGTKLRAKPSDGGSYRIQLAELEVYNTIPDGITTVDSKEYYYKDGFYVTDKFAEQNGEKYYFGKNGVMVKNAQAVINKKLYYFDSDGKMAVSRMYISTENGGCYYATADGTAATDKLVKIGSKTYYFGTNGLRIEKTGFINLDRGRYYIGKNAEVAIGPALITADGAQYYVLSDGLVRDYAGTVAINGTVYLLDSSGRRITGTKTAIIESKTYAVINGCVAVGKGNRIVTVGKKAYAVDKNGVIMTGAKNRIFKVSASKQYVIDKSGSVIKSAKNKLVKVGKKRYIVNKKGLIQKAGRSKLVKVGKKQYVVNKKGVVIKVKKSKSTAKKVRARQGAK